MLGVRLTNISMFDILCFQPPFIVAIVNPYLKKILDDKTWNTSPMMWENLLERMISHLSKWKKVIWGFFIKGDAWFFFFSFVVNMMHDFWKNFFFSFLKALKRFVILLIVKEIMKRLWKKRFFRKVQYFPPIYYFRQLAHLSSG